MRLFRYFEFILESKEEDLLPTLFSRDFINKVQKIDSPISIEFERMTTFGHRQYKTLSKWTFVSLSESNDKIIYTDSSKVRKFVSDTYEIYDDKVVDFVKKLTFPSYDSLFLQFARTEMNIGRFIRAFFGSKFSDAEIEKFVNQWKSLDESSTFDIWSGSDIVKGYSSKFYHFNDYDNGMNPLMNSCMNDMSCVNFYQYCPDVKLLVLLDKESAILGRALLWKDIEGRNIMDRVYFVYDKDYYKFIRWANENDFYYKKSNSGLTKFIKSGKEEIILTGVKILNAFDFPDEEYPYMDTFSFVYKDTAYNYEPKGSYWRFMNTDGTYDIYDYDDW
jgi:hypothetical protein